MPNVIKHGKISMYAEDTTLYVSDKDVLKYDLKETFWRYSCNHYLASYEQAFS